MSSSTQHPSNLTVTVRQASGSTDLRLQCLRVLRCTAQAMAGSPGGLRFKAGTRPWLDELSRLVEAGETLELIGRLSTIVASPRRADVAAEATPASETV